MAKRGRKRRGYFYEDQEQAVADYINSQDEVVRNKVFNTWLKPAFTKMIESIIRRYKLYIPDEEFDETFNDTMSFLMTKIMLFDPSRGTKAYSYCGTICKNYLLSKLNTYNKIRSLEESYEAISDSINESRRYSSGDPDDGEESFLNELISETTHEIDNIIGSRELYNLSDDEVMVGKALINLFENWEDLLVELGSNKFNKSSILLYLKELTRLSTPEIRASMRKYKTAYYKMKRLLIQM